MALRPDTGIPFDATYDPDAAFDLERTGGGGLPAPGPMESAPVRRSGPVNTVGISSDGMWWVNGKEFHRDDHQSAVESQAALDGPERPMPEGYRVVSPDEYKGYLKQIMDPGLGRLMKKNFGIGVDNLQLLGGYGMQLAGAEETGGAIVEQQVEDLRKNQPYQRTFTEDAASDPIGWFVANLAQQGPNLIESALSAIAGAAAGAAIGGNPFTAIGGMMMTLGSKGAVKKALIETAKKKLRGEQLDPTEMKALREAASGAYAFNMKGAAKDVLGGFNKTAAKVGGAALGTGASNYGIGAADVYGEQLDSGTPNRAAALGLAVPYALMESLPELVGFGYFAKGAKVPWKGNKLKRAKNVAGATLLGATGEGLTEAGQESLLLSQNDEVDIASKEGIHRLINSFAAGAGVGGAMSGGASVLRRGPKDRPARNLDEEEHDLLAIGTDGEQLALTDQTERSIEQGDEQDQLTGPEDQLRLEAPTHIGGATADRDAAAIDREYADLTQTMDAIEEQLDNPDLDEATRSDLETQFLEVAERRDIVGGTLTPGEVAAANRGATPILQGGPAALADPGVIEVTDPANVVGPEQQQAAEVEENIQSALAQQVAQQADRQQHQQLVAPQPRGVNTGLAPPTGLPPEVQQPDLSATPFALDALAAVTPVDPLQAESNAIQDQQFGEAEAALRDQQQGDVRLQEQLPLPTPLQPTQPTRSLRKTNPDAPMLLVPHVLEDGPNAGQTVMAPVPVDEVYDASRKELESLQRLQTCLKGGGS